MWQVFEDSSVCVREIELYSRVGQASFFKNFLSSYSFEFFLRSTVTRKTVKASTLLDQGHLMSSMHSRVAGDERFTDDKEFTLVALCPVLYLDRSLAQRLRRESLKKLFCQCGILKYWLLFRHHSRSFARVSRFPRSQAKKSVSSVSDRPERTVVPGKPSITSNSLRWRSLELFSRNKQKSFLFRDCLFVPA